MKPFLILSLCLMLTAAKAQLTLSGTITDKNNEPLIGANIYLQDTYDGATAALDGTFRFETYEQGKQVLVASFMGYETLELELHLTEDQILNLELTEAFNAMEAVTISAGAFEASDKKKVTVLKSLDIATTAGATADITGALNTLPGTQTVGESGRLFVRGGTANETRVFVDGMEAAGYYDARASNMPTRSRFSPFLFKGTFFSTGGYSAEYGQAMSSALILNTLDVAPQSKLELSFMSLGVDAGLTKVAEDKSMYLKACYINLAPYNELISQRVSWDHSPESWDTNFAYKQKLSNGGHVKALMTGSGGHSAFTRPTVTTPSGEEEIDLRNTNLFATTHASLPVGEEDALFVGISGSYNVNDLHYNGVNINTPTVHGHAKARYTAQFGAKTSLNSGVELSYQQFHETVEVDSFDMAKDFAAYVPAAYSELDHYVSERLMVRAGLRYSHHSLLQTQSLSPRLSVAYKLTELAQVSLASGVFRQAPEWTYLKHSQKLEEEQATHYILNFQRAEGQQIFRSEVYLKSYDQLITFEDVSNPHSIKNSGKGYAYGLDLFWRDRGGIENLDYWVSYSWMKSERKYLDFEDWASPGFASAHNLSAVIKRFFPAIRSQMGITYSFTSGRPYENPNLDGFMESKTPAYHDLSFNIAYLPTPNVILYASATNLLGADQVFSYQYGPQRDELGRYPEEAVRLPAKRFIFIGCFITLGAAENQLEKI
ncbi:TonB-dependent receptor [Marinoscillum furvescens]|uniref:Outer membrane cobalamin receptor n=1 Tax=Marinoscillum furvescens DSM 4134 TaxID=1122208 RepID=A0A3D9KWD2_MARFU|nr:TonB-dependent receptor [Marinoscillum furvescens]RED92037.1 outer membrane cobalamin receptor [Marinoscillum furvescens DSM 4134]